MMVWGNLIDAERSAKDAVKDPGEPPSVVPRTWELVARRTDGTVEALARGVLAFDLAVDGSLVYSTGSAVYRRVPDGVRQRLVQAAGIEQVVALG